MMLTSCRKASPYPTGTFVSDTVGTIVIDDEKVHFENMDPDFLENYICTCQTALESIRRIHEGQKMTAEEMETYRKGNTFQGFDGVRAHIAEVLSILRGRTNVNRKVMISMPFRVAIQKRIFSALISFIM